jgi:hypothetical protein
LPGQDESGKKGEIGQISKEDIGMNVGDHVKFQFGGKEKEGVVFKIFPKKVYLKVDFPHHPGKLVVRSVAELEGKSPAPQKKRKKEKLEKAKKEKARRREEKQSKEEE